MKRKLTEKLGGSPHDHERLLMALLMLVHGAAMLLISKVIPPKDTEEARSVFTASVAALLQTAERVKGWPQGRFLARQRTLPRGDKQAP